MNGFVFDVSNNVIYTPAIYQANFTNVRPGTIVAINFADGLGSIEVEIGTTGAYYVLVKDKAISSITLLRAGNDKVLNRNLDNELPHISEWENARLTFCYYDSKPTDNFSKISSISVQDEFRQYIGLNHNINIIETLEDIRRETGRFHYIRVHERHMMRIYNTYKGWSRNPYGTDLIYDYDWNPATIYYSDGKYYDINFKGTQDTIDDIESIYYYDGDIKKPMSPPSYLFELNDSGIIHLDGRKLPIEVKKDLEKYSQWKPETLGRIDSINGIENVTNLRLDTGLIVEIAYRIKIKEYAVEDENAQTNGAKFEWQKAIENWNKVLSNSKSNKNTIQNALSQIEDSYALYVRMIEKALSEEVE